MSTLSDTIAARLQQQRNPNFSTDRGLNSVSPYFLPTGQTSSSIQQGWSDTGAAVDDYAAQGRAKVKAANDLAAAQAAAEQARKAQAAAEAQAQKAATAQAAALAKQRAEAARAQAGFAQQLKAAKKAARANATGQGKIPSFVPGGKQGVGFTTVSRQRAISLANSYVGKTPYVLGGTTHQGIDCSGLVMAVYNQMGFGIRVHGATWQGRNIPGVRVPWGSKAAQPGDIVAWKDGSHIAIYAGNGQIIEAAHPGTRVRYHSLWASPSAVTVIHLNI